MALERYEFNRAGYIKILRSPGVERMLQAKANRVKRAAEARLVGEDVFLIADTNRGRNRVGATVIGVPMRIEADRRVLGNAIQAAR